MRSADVLIAHYRPSDGTVRDLSAHLLRTGRLAAVHGKKIGLAAAAELCGAAHDLGKAAQTFIEYICSAVGLLNPDEDGVDAKDLKGRIDHSTAGAQLIWQALCNGTPEQRLAGQIMALCVASHHSGLINCLGADGETFGVDAFALRMAKDDGQTHLEEARARIDPDVLQRIQELMSGPAVEQIHDRVFRILRREQLLQGRKLHPFLNVVAQNKLGLLVRMLLSCLIEADRTDSAEFARGHIDGNERAITDKNVNKSRIWSTLCNRLESKLEGWKPQLPIDFIRQRISEDCKLAAARGKGIFRLTVPTGGGKTLASLRLGLNHAALHGMDRVFYIIPFISILDQNAEVVRSVLERSGDQGSLVLEHHSNLTPERQTWRQKLLCENWDAPVVYTTMVQLLEVLFGAGTRGVRRMHSLANSVIVFDEIQTLPIRCVHLFANAVNFLVDECGCSVILCTATQPLLHQVDPLKGAVRLRPGDEVMGNVEALFRDLRRVEVHDMTRDGGWSHRDIASLAVDALHKLGSALVIANTKAGARAVFEDCRTLTDVPVFHLSTSMCPAHRKEVLATVRRKLADKEPVICVSTQMIEAGVDVDFGAVVRFLAGLDSIAQAAGRCNRNGARERGIVFIVNPSDEELGKLEDIRRGRDDAARVLREFARDPEVFDGDCLGPRAMTRYFEYYFGQRKSQMGYRVPAEKIGHDDEILNLLSLNKQSKSEHKRLYGVETDAVLLQHAFMTAAKAFDAIDTDGQGVVVPYGDGAEIIQRLRGYPQPELIPVALLKQAQQFSVNVTPKQLENMEFEQSIFEVVDGAGIYAARPDFYSLDFGLSRDPVDGVNVKNQKVM